MRMDGFAVFYRPLENTYKIAVIIIIKTFKENVEVAKQGGSVAGNARKEIEKKLSNFKTRHKKACFNHFIKLFVDFTATIC